SEHGDTIEKLGELTERANEIEGKSNEFAEALIETSERVAELEDAVSDCYFHVANSIFIPARAEWGDSLMQAPPAVRESMRALNSFYSDDTARRREAQLVGAEAGLQERDAAMAA